MSTIVDWLRDGLRSRGDVVDIHVIASSASDPNSRRLLRPNSWLRAVGSAPGSAGTTRWGAHLAEFEPVRYLPRARMTRTLDTYQLVQVVCGTPAVATAVLPVSTPVVLQTATRVAWEREALTKTKSRRSRVLNASGGIVGRLEVTAMRGVDAVLVENDRMLAFARACGQPNAILAPPGVDTTRFFPDPAGWRSDGCVLAVCRLGDPRKGLPRLVRSYGYLRTLLDPCPRLTLAGRGTLGEDVARLIRDLGLMGCVNVLSDVPAEDLPGLLRSAAVFVQASYEEGLGLSVLEAMASGLPVVATRTAGSEVTVVEGVTGFLVDQDAADDAVAHGMAARLHEVLSRSGQSFSSGARARAETRFSDSAALDRFVDVHDRLVLGGQNDRRPR